MFAAWRVQELRLADLLLRDMDVFRPFLAADEAGTLDRLQVACRRELFRRQDHARWRTVDDRARRLFAQWDDPSLDLARRLFGDEVLLMPYLTHPQVAALRSVNRALRLEGSAPLPA